MADAPKTVPNIENVEIDRAGRLRAKDDPQTTRNEWVAKAAKSNAGAGGISRSVDSGMTPDEQDRVLGASVGRVKLHRDPGR